jgi:hypothetical protein
MTLVGVIREPIIRAHYLEKVSRLVLLDPDALNERSRQARPAQRTQQSDRRPVAARVVKADPREGFLLALLVQWRQLREAGLEVPPDVFWDTEAGQMYEIWRNCDENVLKSALPAELMDYFERLILWKLPLSTEKEASEALQDCVRKLNQRRLQAEKQAIAAQIADLQEQMGVSLFDGEPAGALSASEEGDTTAQPADPEGESELQELLRRDMQIGWELHRRDRKGDGHQTDADDADAPPEDGRGVGDGRQAAEITVDG